MYRPPSSTTEMLGSGGLPTEKTSPTTLSTIPENASSDDRREGNSSV